MADSLDEHDEPRDDEAALLEIESVKQVADEQTDDRHAAKQAAREVEEQEERRGGDGGSGGGVRIWWRRRTVARLGRRRTVAREILVRVDRATQVNRL